MSGAIRALVASILLLADPCAAVETPAGGIDVVLLVETSGSMAGFGKQALSAFAESLGREARVALVTFGDEASLVLPLGSVEGKHKGKLGQAIGGLTFSSTYTDLGAGLGLSLAQLALHGREDARKAVVLLGSGRLEPSDAGDGREEILSELRTEILYGYFVEEVAIYAVAFGDADVELMQEIGSSTRGRCVVTPDALALADGLDLLAVAIAPVGGPGPEPGPAGVTPPAAEVAAAEPSSASLPSVFALAGGGVAALVLVLGMLILALVLVNTIRLGTLARSQPARPRSSSDEPGAFAGLRKKAGRITKLLMEARSSLEGFNVDLEDYAAESWEKEKELKNRYYSLASNLFLLIDHLEVQDRAEEARVGVEWLVMKARKILASESIEEIPVREGDTFDGMYHKHAGDRADSRPAGAVVEVSRKGYHIRKGAGEDDLILRHAEVIVSTGKAERKAG